MELTDGFKANIIDFGGQVTYTKAAGDAFVDLKTTVEQTA